jgi:C4-dicarboxylate-specific signal transduction histidine kinase
LSLSTNNDEGILEIGVQGNDGAIPADIQSWFSQPFWSGKINNKNAGLSFSIYREVAIAYRGSFSSSDVPEGTRDFS